MITIQVNDAFTDRSLPCVGQQDGEQMQNQSHSTEGQPLHPQWDMNQHTLSSGEQQATEAPLQQGNPSRRNPGHPGGYGQAASSQGPFDTAAAPEHHWEPHPAGVLGATSWPAEVCALQLTAIASCFCVLHTGRVLCFSRCQSPACMHSDMCALQALSAAPMQDPYASGGQNYYGAGWRAGAQDGGPEVGKPANKSSSSWGKLGFWGGGQPAESPAQPAPDEGVLYYGATEVRCLCRSWNRFTGKPGRRLQGVLLCIASIDEVQCGAGICRFSTSAIWIPLPAACSRRVWRLPTRTRHAYSSASAGSNALWRPSSPDQCPALQ